MPNITSGVARAFPGGRPHPEDQNEEENEENLRKQMRETTGKLSKIEEVFLSCPPWSERLAVALNITKQKTQNITSTASHSFCLITSQINFDEIM